MADEEGTTEAAVVNSESGLDIRGSLEHNFESVEESKYSRADTAIEPTRSKIDRQDSAESSGDASVPRAVAPPQDMNAQERAAFMAPTGENTHILQSYLSRRAHETRTEYERRKVEVDRLHNENQGLYNAYNPYKEEYSKMGLSPTLVTERSIAWDMAMRESPVQTALEWLDAYGVTPADLYQQPEQYQDYQQYDQGYQQYPQQNYMQGADVSQLVDQRIQEITQQQEQNMLAQDNLDLVQSFMKGKTLFTATDPQTAAQLEEKMAPVVQALAQQGGSPHDILETAYNYVVRGDPMFSDLSNRLDAAGQVNAKSNEAAKARRASRSISGSVGSGSPRLEIKNIRDNLRRRLSGD